MVCSIKSQLRLARKITSVMWHISRILCVLKLCYITGEDIALVQCNVSLSTEVIYDRFVEKQSMASCSYVSI